MTIILLFGVVSIEITTRWFWLRRLFVLVCVGVLSFSAPNSNLIIFSLLVPLIPYVVQILSQVINYVLHVLNRLFRKVLYVDTTRHFNLFSSFVKVFSIFGVAELRVSWDDFLVILEEKLIINEVLKGFINFFKVDLAVILHILRDITLFRRHILADQFQSFNLSCAMFRINWRSCGFQRLLIIVLAFHSSFVERNDPALFGRCRMVLRSINLILPLTTLCTNKIIQNDPQIFINLLDSFPLHLLHHLEKSICKFFSTALPKHCSHIIIVSSRILSLNSKLLHLQQLLKNGQF